jgi:hypothetical protein
MPDRSHHPDENPRGPRGFAEWPGFDPLPLKSIGAVEGYRTIGMYQAALDELRALPQTEQDHPHALQLLSCIYWELNDIPRACDATDAFIRAQPLHPFGYCFKSMLFARAGQHRKAYDLLKTVIENFPGHATMHYDLACAAASCAFWSEAQHWVYLAICSQQSLKEVALQNEVFTPIKGAIEAMEPSS